MARPALLVDAGALIAVVNNRDQYHSSISKTLAGFFGELLTTWPAVAEACHILPVHLGPALLGWLSTSRWRTLGMENRAQAARTHAEVCGQANGSGGRIDGMGGRTDWTSPNPHH